MANNNAIQILRTNLGYNIENSEVEILDGQPLYHRDDNSLYVGNDNKELKDLYPINYLKGNSERLSIEQASYPNSQNAKNPVASGFGSVAFGGFRYDHAQLGKQPSPSDTTNEAAGDQSFVAGCGNYTIGDWSFVTGKDNKNYANRAFVTGGANRIQQGNVALSSDDKTIVLDKDNNIQFENTSTTKTNNGRFNAVFGNNNIFVSTRNNSDSKGWCESNLITGGSNIISSENGVVSRNIIGGYSNYLLPDGKAYDDSKQFNIVGGENNRIYGHLGNSIVSGSKNSIQGITTSIISGSDNNVRYLTQSLVIGKGLNAPNTVDNELPTAIIGKYNTHKPNALFVVGNGTGTSDVNRSNAFEVLEKSSLDGGISTINVNGKLHTTSLVHALGNLETEGYILANGDNNVGYKYSFKDDGAEINNNLKIGNYSIPYSSYYILDDGAVQLLLKNPDGTINFTGISNKSAVRKLVLENATINSGALAEFNKLEEVVLPYFYPADADSISKNVNINTENEFVYKRFGAFFSNSLSADYNKLKDPIINLGDNTLRDFYNTEIPKSLKKVVITGGDIIPPYWLYTGNNTGTETTDETGNSVASIPLGNIEEVALPDSLKTISLHAINFTSITKIRIPYGVTTINNAAFYENPKLTDVYIPDGIKSLGYSMFYNSKISKLRLPKTLETIDCTAFSPFKMGGQLIFDGNINALGNINVVADYKGLGRLKDENGNDVSKKLKDVTTTNNTLTGKRPDNNTQVTVTIPWNIYKLKIISGDELVINSITTMNNNVDITSGNLVLGNIPIRALKDEDGNNIIEIF